jgi:tryptophan 7-halogenase
MPKIQTVVVLGGGSAGLLAALTLKRKLPGLAVEVVFSSKIGVIGVGEGTVPYVPGHLHGYLGLSEHEVFQAITPVFKLGVRFTWGRRPYFDYTFSGQQYTWKWPDQQHCCGYYVERDPVGADLSSALMEAGKALPRRPDRLPEVPLPGTNFAWHIENRTFVAWLESACRREGVTFTDAVLTGVERGGERIARLHLSDGSERRADLFVDSSGFASELLGKALEEPFSDFSDALFCDRAVAGGWDRSDEPILTYTVSDTMDSGWCWRIDHPDRIHRGYVFSSDHATDDEAVEAYRRVAPKATNPRIVQFRSGQHRNAWVGNVLGIGNACGFVEPLEATALMVICVQLRAFTEGLLDSECDPTPGIRKLYNDATRRMWEEIRDFLAIHYRFNVRLDTPFWKRCREETALGGVADLVAFYEENGPSPLGADCLAFGNPFRLEGHLAILCGLGVPHQRPRHLAEKDLSLWNAKRQTFGRVARDGVGMREALQLLADPAVWRRLRGAPIGGAGAPSRLGV